MRNFIVFGFLVLAFASALTAEAAEGCNVLMSGDRNVLISFNQGADGYLLLPIEESAPKTDVSVSINGRKQEGFTLRLAKNRIDYYVPYLISSPDILLNIVSPYDFLNNICWNNLKLSDKFDTTNREKFRPLYHHTPAYGWMNDPNGMYYDSATGLWHLYYQYNPYDSMWGNMTWGHSVSKDLIHWDFLSPAIYPDELGMIFSGSAVVDSANTAGFGKDAVVALYTSAVASQMQSMAYSVDGGNTFTKYSGNPVITDRIPDFRDPKVFRNEVTGGWTMVLACGQELRFYSSKDLKNWSYDSSFGTGYGCHKGVWECPDLLKLKVRGSDEYKWLLIVNINPGFYAGGSGTQYFIGDYDGKEFTTNQTETKWMDYGKDHYATVSFHNAPDNRSVVMAWMSNWQYAEILPTKQFRSQNSLPRDLDIFKGADGDYYVGVSWSVEADAIVGDELFSKSYKASETPTLSFIDGNPSVLDITIDAGKSAETCIKLYNSDGDSVNIAFDFIKGVVNFERPSYRGGRNIPGIKALTTAEIKLQKGEKISKQSIRLYLDHSSIELFDKAGRFAITNQIFPLEKFDKISVWSKSGKAKINIKQYTIKK